MAVTQIAVLTQFVTTSVNAVADLNGDLAAIRNQFNALVTANNTLISGLTIPSPTITTAIVLPTLTQDLLFTDGLYDIGKTGATRPRDIFTSRNVSVGGTLAVAGNIVSDLLFTDATYDIGKSLATRPRDGFFSRDVEVGNDLRSGGSRYVYSYAGGAVGSIRAGMFMDGTNQILAIWASNSEMARFTAGAFMIRTTVSTSAASGEVVILNNKNLRAVNAAGTDTLALLKLDASNKVSIDAGAQGALFGGSVAFSTAVGKIVPGATSLSWRNNADSADNLLISDAGAATLRSTLTLSAGLTFTQATAKIALPSGSFVDFRLASDAGSALLIRDTGTVQMSNGQLNTAAGTTAYASLLIPSGAAPTSPVDGQLWYNGTNLLFRNGGTTRTVTWV